MTVVSLRLPCCVCLFVVFLELPYTHFFIYISILCLYKAILYRICFSVFGCLFCFDLHLFY